MTKSPHFELSDNLHAAGNALAIRFKKHRTFFGAIVALDLVKESTTISRKPRYSYSMMAKGVYGKIGERLLVEGIEMFDRITFDPKIMEGHACIRGMHIPVSEMILKKLP